MSTFNTSVSRAITRPRQGARQSADRNRSAGGTTLADADQRGSGIFGFPTIGERINRRRDRQSGGTGTAPTTAPTAAPGDVAGTVAGLEAGGRVVSDVQRDVLGGVSPEALATIDESTANADAINAILARAREPLAEFDPFSSPLAAAGEASVLAGLANPEAISEAAQQAAISSATDAILGSQRSNAQNLQENFAARGISDSGLSFALAQAGGEAAGRDIAGVRRDVLLQSELARSQREAQLQQLAISGGLSGAGLDLRAAEGESALTAGEAFPVVDFAGIEAGNDLTLALDAAEDDDAERQFDDFLSTGLGGLVSFAAGQAVRSGRPGLAAIIGLLGLGGARSIENRGS